MASYFRFYLETLNCKILQVSEQKQQMHDALTTFDSQFKSLHNARAIDESMIEGKVDLVVDV